MNDLQLGKMYCVKQYFWLLFPMKELARAASMATVRAWAEVAYQYAKQYSEQYKCNVAVVEENTCFVLLEHDEPYFKVLDSNGNIGWIRCRDFSDYFKLVKE